MSRVLSEFIVTRFYFKKVMKLLINTFFKIIKIIFKTAIFLSSAEVLLPALLNLDMGKVAE